MPFDTADDLKQAVRQALEGLGDTKEKVAETLRSKGIKGKRAITCECPVARYLKAQLPELRGLSVVAGFSHGEYWTGQDCEHYMRAEADNPEPVGDFVSAFDFGEFPDLEEK